MRISGQLEPAQAAAIPARYVERETEVGKVLAAAGAPDPKGRQSWPARDLALAAVLAGTGARASEVCGMRVRDLVLDVEDPYVRVTGKSGTMRDCPFPPEVAAAVLAYLESREQTKQRPRRNDPVWLNNHGEPLAPGSLDHHVRRWFARAGVPSRPAPRPMRFGTRWRCSWSAAARRSTSSRRSSATRRSAPRSYIRAADHHVRDAAHTLPVRGQLRKLVARAEREEASGR